MDSLFHFVFAFIAGMAVNVKLAHPVRWVALTAFAAVLIDVDHFLFAYPRAFHTVFVTVLLPTVLFAAAFYQERGTDRIRLQSLVILLFVMLNGHLVADLLSGGTIRLFYPLATAVVSLPAGGIPLGEPYWYLAAGEGVILTVYGGIIGLAYFAEAFVYLVERRHESAAQALHDTLPQPI